MILSRAKPASKESSSASGQRAPASAKTKIPDLEEFLRSRDYTGAMALLEFNKKTGKETPHDDLWVAYCNFHLGDYSAALKMYETILKAKNLPRRRNSSIPDASAGAPAVDGVNATSLAPPKGSSEHYNTLDDVWLFTACCQFFLGMYSEAEESVSRVGVRPPLRNRLEFHLAHKSGDEKTLMRHHQQLQDILQDQLCLASIHYLRSHYQEAIDIYKKILLEHRNFVALNVYIALCYYKLDYYDVSQEVLAVYLQQFPDSVVAINLKACNHYRLYNGKAAETEIRTFIDASSSSFTFAKDLIRHNLVAFRGGEGALQVFPQLIDMLPEARLNLVIYYLRNDEIQEAFNLLKDLEPSVPHEYILKGVVNAALGQDSGNRESLKVAQQFFQLVGGSASECDTIPGRQCMASCFFIMKQFDDVLLYLSSIKSYFYNDDTFNFDYAQAKAATGNFKEAEETFLMIQSDKIRADFVYISWLTRCYIINRKPDEAWALFRKLDGTSNGFTLLTLIANESYKMGLFLHAAKAFDMLEKHEQIPEYWEGKRGACCGYFQLVVADKEPSDGLNEILRILRGSSNAQAEHISNIMKAWLKEATKTGKM